MIYRGDFFISFDNYIKKVLVLIIAAFMITAFVACGDDVDENITTATTNMTTATKRDNTYKITAVEFESEDGNINISYPQISGLYDETMQNYYNQLFKSDFEACLSDEENYMCFADYQVTLKTGDTLCIVFRSWSCAYGWAHPRAESYAYNLNLQTGETFIPSESVDINKAFANFTSGKDWEIQYSPDDNKNKEDFIECYTEYQYMTSNFPEKNVVTVKRNSEDNYTTAGNAKCHSYLDEDSETILILDVWHTLGDYVEIKFN